MAAGILGAMRGVLSPVLYEIARCQAGIVSRRQALEAGLTPGVIVSRIKYGRWQQIYRGVYATYTGPLSREARLWAAVLYAGKGARLSHQTAAELHGLADAPASPIHLTVPASRRVRQAEGLRIHVCALVCEQSAFRRGILPHTPIETTILDLVDAARGSDEALRWVTRAHQRGLTSTERLLAAMGGRKKLRWRHPLAELVADLAR